MQLLGEKETLGFYLTGHPLNKYAHEIRHLTTGRIAELTPNAKKTARAAGVVTNIRTRQTKRGDRIGIFTLDDGSSQIEVVCFSEIFQKNRALIAEDQLVIVEGEVSMDDFSNSPRIVGRELYTIEHARMRTAKHLEIEFHPEQALDPEQLKNLLASHLGGKCPILLRMLRDNVQTTLRLGKNWQVSPTDTLLALLGKNLKKVDVIY